MTKTKMSNFPTQSGSFGEPGSTVAVSLRGGRRAGFSVKFRRRIALVIIASILLWGGLFCLLWLL
jgi:hypothetical protein